MAFYVFTGSNDVQQADFFQSVLSDGVLGEWPSQETFEAEGWKLEQVGGFKLTTKGKLTFNAALKAEHDAKVEAANAVATGMDKEALREQTHKAMRAIFALLPLETQEAFFASPRFASINSAMGVSLELGRSKIEEWVPADPQAGALKNSLLACFPVVEG
ncbi:hypothetical protein UFOVP380_11 [uncultured Caudovirales phage]|uniref:Uncharacterized protein n=1 Tax=uncultured Caudovirales phage TaxID=2100421 RepID=A0A6J7WZD6_9CAUD|nr:hypothetical protein UFOVP380_11 [uncultured Caudovirales phage]